MDAARPPNPEAEAFARNLIELAAHRRLPALIHGDSRHAIYRIPDRNGISVSVIRTRDLSDEQLVDLMKYRLAQYLAVGFVDPQMIYDAHMEHEPLSGVLPDDVHLIAASSDTGEILCFATLE